VWLCVSDSYDARLCGCVFLTSMMLCCVVVLLWQLWCVVVLRDSDSYDAWLCCVILIAMMLGCVIVCFWQLWCLVVLFVCFWQLWCLVALWCDSDIYDAGLCDSDSYNVWLCCCVILTAMMLGCVVWWFWQLCEEHEVQRIKMLQNEMWIGCNVASVGANKLDEVTV